MQVFIVGISDCETNSIKVVCTTKDIAKRELFKIRDELIVEWKKSDKTLQEDISAYCKKHNKHLWSDNIYKKMITALSGNNYENWDNGPHDKPYLYEVTVMEK